MSAAPPLHFFSFSLLLCSAADARVKDEGEGEWGGRRHTAQCGRCSVRECHRADQAVPGVAVGGGGGRTLERVHTVVRLGVARLGVAGRGQAAQATGESA